MTDHPFPHGRTRTAFYGFALGLIAGLVVFLIRMMIDVDRIGANAIPYVLVGGVVGAVLGSVIRRR